MAKYNKRTSHSNRGRDFQTYINQSIERYATLEVAEIEEVATPIRVEKVDRTTKKITSAFFERKSTVDYIGIVKGKFIGFDAKETADANKFPLKNVHEHQIIKLVRYMRQGGISFLLVHFKSQQETYILKTQDLMKWVEGSGASIPYQFFKEHCKRCGPGRNISIDFLAALEM